MESKATAFVAGLALGTLAGLAIAAAVKRSRERAAAEAAEQVAAEPVTAPRPLPRMPFNPANFRWAPVRKARPAAALMFALVRLTLAAVVAAVTDPLEIPRIAPQVFVLEPAVFPRQYRAPRVDLWSTQCRRSVPVRGPDRPAWPFPGVAALM